jgi:hypothetical protein
MYYAYLLYICIVDYPSFRLHQKYVRCNWDDDTFLQIFRGKKSAEIDPEKTFFGENTGQ